MTDHQRTGGVAQVLSAVLIWGASFVATKVALREIPPVSVVWLRFGMGLAVLAVLRRAGGGTPMPARSLPLLALLGFIGTTLHQILQATGLQTASAITTGWIVTTTPLFIAVLGWLFLRERLNRVAGLGIALAAAGVLLVVSRGDVGSILRGSFGTAGDFLVVLAALSWAVFSVISRTMLRDHPPVQMMFYIMLFGWMSASVLFAAGGSLDQVLQMSPAGWAAVSFLGVFCSGLAYMFWYGALKVLPAAEAGSFMYLEPLVTMLVAFLVLREAPVALALLGGAMIIGGVWVVAHSAA